MAKERLSRLQKWILIEAYKNIAIPRRHIRLFFGKWFHPGKYNFNLDDTPSFEAMMGEDKEKAFDRKFFNWQEVNDRFGKRELPLMKKEYQSTKAIEVTISRALKNMIEKGILQKNPDWENYILTEKGFLMLTKTQKVPLVNFKEYVKKVEADEGITFLMVGDLKRLEKTTKEVMKKGIWKDKEKNQGIKS